MTCGSLTILIANKVVEIYFKELWRTRTVAATIINSIRGSITFVCVPLNYFRDKIAWRCSIDGAKFKRT